MPELNVIIGGRSFSVNCQDGEEPFVQAAAALLDAEAKPLVAAMGRLPEGKLLLMAGLMLADKTLSYEQERQELYARIAELEARPAPPPEQIEVEVVPIALAGSLSEMALRAEALAAQLEHALNPIAAPEPLAANPIVAEQPAPALATEAAPEAAPAPTPEAKASAPLVEEPADLPPSVAVAMRTGNDPVVFDPSAE